MAELKIAIDDVEWMQELGGTCGIYLITDERDGQHYVGSASGNLGLLKRWRDYVATGHGGNQQLIELLQENGARVNDFRFPISDFRFPISDFRFPISDLHCLRQSR